MSSAHRLIRTVIFAAWMCTAVLGFAANALVTLVLSTALSLARVGACGRRGRGAGLHDRSTYSYFDRPRYRVRTYVGGSISAFAPLIKG